MRTEPNIGKARHICEFIRVNRNHFDVRMLGRVLEVAPSGN